MHATINRHWREISRNLTIMASMADRFLTLTPDDRRDVLRGPGSDRLQAYSAWQLAQARRQANEILMLLEQAEAAWRETVADEAIHDA